ncbi:MAG: hypothetical protein V2A73_16025 [Pseudomonadota bacterium]
MHDLRRALKSFVSVGWFENVEHKAEEGTVPTALIAATHEFGSPKRHIPARPMLRFVADQHGKEYRALAKRLWDELLAGKLPSVESALTILGARIEADVKRRISDGPFEPLSQRTIDKKGSSQPLIDTGAMRAQVTNRVVILR